MPDLTRENVFRGRVTIDDDTPAELQRGALVVGGGVAVKGDLFVHSTYNLSDEGTKGHIRPLTGARALGTLRRLRGYRFRWRVPHPRAGTASAGLLARAVARVLPTAVSVDPVTGRLAVDYVQLLPYLLEAVRALDRRTGGGRRARG